jgi:hypothetical protein
VEGDEPMDRLVDWMFAGNPREARVLMERAINEGIASVPEAPAALRDFFAIIEREPEWLDRKLLEEGVSFIHRTGLAGPYVLRDFALMGGYLLSGFNKALILTGALNKSAAQRIAETGKCGSTVQSTAVWSVSVMASSPPFMCAWCTQWCAGIFQKIRSGIMPKMVCP